MVGGTPAPAIYSKSQKWQEEPVKLIKSKTFWTAIAAIATGVGFIVGGNIDTGIELVAGGLIAIFMRNKLEKGPK